MHWTDADVFLPAVSAVLWAGATLVSWQDSGRSLLTAVCALNLILQLALAVRHAGTPKP
jgi:hypothetical protein